MTVDDEDLILKILTELQTCQIDVVNTLKNRETRLRLGITLLDQEEIVRSIKRDDYFEGPMPDKGRDDDKQLFVFKKEYNGHKMYIKIKEKQIINNKKTIKCLSCHIDYM